MADILDNIEDIVDEDLFDDEDTIGVDEIEFIDDEDFDNAVVLDDEMDVNQAQEITNAIRSTALAIYKLLELAREGKAYKALGYNTWEEYVKQELDMSASRSYQLLDLGKAVKMIEAAAPEGTDVKLTEAQARDIKKQLPLITERIKEETFDMEPDEASSRIDEIISEQREQKKFDEKALADKEKQLEEEELEMERKKLESQADALLDAASSDSESEYGFDVDPTNNFTDSADDGFVEVEVEGEGGISPTDSMNLYNFVNSLNSVESLPEPDDLLKIIPENRFDDVYDQVMQAASYFNRLSTLMEVEANER